LATKDAGGYADRAVGRRAPSSEFCEGFRYAASRSEAGVAAIIDEQLTKRRSAEPHRVFEDCVKHRRKIAGRRVDDLQHLRHRGFSGERFVALGSPCVELPPQCGYGLSEIKLCIVGHRLLLAGPPASHSTIPFCPVPCQQVWPSQSLG
jgi:hypothetical protein